MEDNLIVINNCSCKNGVNLYMIPYAQIATKSNKIKE